MKGHQLLKYLPEKYKKVLKLKNILTKTGNQERSLTSFIKLLLY